MGVEDSFSGLLFEIESAIVSVVHQHDKLVDRHILFALEDLYKFYDRKKKGKLGHFPVPMGLEGKVFEAIKRICEDWLVAEPVVTILVVNRCIKRLIKSVKFWSKSDGQKGYINYVRPFVEEAVV